MDHHAQRTPSLPPPSLPTLHLMLKHVDSVLYVDSDTLFLQPVDRLWSFLDD